MILSFLLGCKEYCGEVKWAISSQVLRRKKGGKGD
jgi:hypothetical protein